MMAAVVGSPLPLRPLLAAVNLAAPEKAAAIPHPHLVAAGVMTAVVAEEVEEAAAVVAAATPAKALAPTRVTTARYIP
jgi:hypothetical protein